MRFLLIKPFELKRINILRGQKTFDLIFSEGKVFSNSLFSLRFISDRSENQATVRAGFLVKRTFGNAIKRNKIKRLMREAYRVNQQNFVAFFSARNINLSMVFLVKTIKSERFSLKVVESSMLELIQKVVEFHEAHTNSSH